MHRFTTLFSGVLFIAALLNPTATLADETENLRGRLLDIKSIETLYSIDDFYTLVTVEGGKEEEAVTELKNLCAEAGGAFERVKGKNSPEIKCAGSFETVEVEEKSSRNGKRSFLIKNAKPQPVAYKNPSLPSFNEISTPPNGRIKINYSSIELYEYMYALCKKENGVASFVIPKRNGKIVRLTQVNATEAFMYLLSAGNGKESWFFACEGDKRFVLEKEYTFEPSQGHKFNFFSNRGLEGVDYVRSNSGPDSHLNNSASLYPYSQGPFLAFGDTSR